MKIPLFFYVLTLSLFSFSHEKIQNFNKLNLTQIESAGESYPLDWWKEIPQSDLKDWEIAPQSVSVQDKKVILSKRTELGVFSNLGLSPFILDQIKYQSVEALWQGMKYPESLNDERNSALVQWPYKREQVYQLSGFESKEAGDVANANMKKLGIQWITYQNHKIYYKTEQGQWEHFKIICRATLQKVKQNPEIAKLLQQTVGLELLPDHNQGSNVLPAYQYYKILMNIRDRAHYNCESL